MTRAQRWARSWGAAALAGCALLVVMVAGGAPAGAASESAPTLSRVVLPNLGLGYSVTSQGPLNASQFASNAPDPSAAALALSTLGKSISTYERVWQSVGGLNQVQDLLVRFPDGSGAQVFLLAAQHSLESGEIVSSDALPSIPGARRVTYFAAINQDGVGEAITMRAGIYVDLFSIFSAASGNAHPISPTNAERLAQTQHTAMVQASGGATTTTSAAPTTSTKKGVSAGTIALAVLAVAIAAAAVATPGLLKRRRLAQEAAATTALPRGPAPSGGDAIDDLREHSG